MKATGKGIGNFFTIAILLLFFVIIFSGFQGSRKHNKNTFSNSSVPPFLIEESKWVDSVFNSLSEDEKIAQLLVYPAYSNSTKEHENTIKEYIEEYKIGGLIFMQGGPVRQAVLTNKYQEISKVPLLISMDAESSLYMRLDSTVQYPYNMMTGAITDNYFLYQLGKEYARQLKRIGVHVNYAPVIDINNNPNNPVINDRSYGEDIYNVSTKGMFFMKGMQDNGVMAVAKHFPGHGDTETDSHVSLPKIMHNFATIDTIHLVPFRYLIHNGISGIMVSHLFVPAIDSQSNRPSTISKLAIDSLLISKLGFKGLVFTDAMNMKGIKNYVKDIEAEIEAIASGNDVLLFPGKPEILIPAIKKAIEENRISWDKINKSCKKILKAKYWLGLNKIETINTDNIIEDLNNISAKLIQEALIEKSLTVVRNENNIIPLQRLDSLKIATLIIGSEDTTKFEKRIQYYYKSDNIFYDINSSEEADSILLSKLKEYNLIFIAVHGMNRNPKTNYNISEKKLNIINRIPEQQKAILCLFGNPYSILSLKDALKFEAITVSYNDWDLTNDLTAQLVFGGIAAKGKLPVNVCQCLPFDEIIITEKTRLKYSSIPESVGVNSEYLKKIDSIIDYSIENKIFPGGQIVAAKDNVVFYQRSFGNFTYDKESKKVEDLDIYDLASLTKVLSTALAMQKLYDENQYSLDDKISKTLDFLDKRDKDDITIKELLTHKSGLISWINFHSNTTLPENYSKWYKNEYCSDFPYQVCDSMFIIKSVKDSILKQIVDSKLKKKKNYLYSDLGFYLLKEFVEKKSNEKIDNYVENNFYKKIGAWTMCFNPLKRFDKYFIAPTEDDKTYRKTTIQGYVHDQGAAMMGGISGHAGLFASANDEAKILQLLLNFGTYGKEQYLTKSSTKLFTEYNTDDSNSKRGLAWEKKNPHIEGSASESSSEESFGHSGFTGPLIWADPKYNFFFVINCNRTYPDSNNKKILKENTRTNIEELLYQSFLGEKQQ